MINIRIFALEQMFFMTTELLNRDGVRVNPLRQKIPILFRKTILIYDNENINLK